MEPSRPEVSCTLVRRLLAGRTIFLGPETEQSLVRLIVFAWPARQRRFQGGILIEVLNLRCMPDKFRPTIFVPAEENSNG
jgi:hypothetical protein